MRSPGRPCRVVAFGEDNAGELYFLDYDTGTVHTLERNKDQGQNKHFPTTLSDTGLFASVKEQKPAPGVEPFQIVHQWQDGATAQHWVALPGTSSVTVYPGEGKIIPSQVYWHKFRMHFPRDAVLVKTLSLGGRYVETQLLHFDGLDWRAYSYAWRDDQSEADLVPAAGSEKILQVADKVGNALRGVPGGKREMVWPFFNRTQCIQCHNQWPRYALAFSLGQLNRDQQLERFSQLGFIQRKTLDDKPQLPYDSASAAKEERLYDPFQPEAGTLDQRARSYLHVNCAHCHRFGGGGTVLLELVADKKLDALKVLDVRPARGDFGLPEARIIAPGHPERSTLYYRMAKFGKDRMPHIGAELPDEAGLKLVGDWIRSLRFSSDAELSRQLARPEEALALARMLGRGELPRADRDRLLALAAKLPYGPTRDLFEGYLPSDGKERKLGPNPRPSAILSRTGDAGRGKALFWATANKCADCHKIGDKGINLGPELTLIGKQRKREELLESILEPSVKIEPAFTAYLVVTAQGKSLTGLLVRRDAKEVVLRDAQNKEVVVPNKDVEQFQPSRVSLMPAGMLAHLTAQEAADLLDYLVSCR